MVRIAQITDTHIGIPEQQIRGLPVCENFKAVIAQLRQEQIDLLILSGDLVHDTGEPSYCWIRDQLADFPTPKLFMAGNHDDARILQKVIPQAQSEWIEGLCLATSMGSTKIVCLDTSSNSCPAAQLDWLEQQLKDTPDNIVFMHHPPSLCQARFMDENYPLRNHHETLERLKTMPHVRNIFCGHYHTEKEIKLGELTIFLTPSTAMQIDRSSQDFAISSLRPGWRLIDIGQGELKTHCQYLS